MKSVDDWISGDITLEDYEAVACFLAQGVIDLAKKADPDLLSCITLASLHEAGMSKRQARLAMACLVSAEMDAQEDEVAKTKEPQP